MPPHLALQIPDILSIIFENLYDKNDPDFFTLTSVAYTCKLFSAPALAIVWRRLDSLWNLLDVIPCFDPGPDAISNYKYDFCDAVEPADWLRLESYAAFVREFSITEERVHDFHTSVFVVLACHFKGKPMLPSLATLTFGRANALSLLPLFLAPTLRCISLVGQPPSDILHIGHLKMISKEAPLIKKLGITAILSRKSYGTISNFPSLRALSITHPSDVPGDVPLDVISSFPFLVELGLNFGPILGSVSPSDLTFQCPCFESLRSLSLIASLGLINSILTMFTLIPLKSITIHVYNSIPFDRIDEVMTQFLITTRNIARWANTLEHLEVDWSGRPYLEEVEGIPQLEPLLSCYHLQHVAVRGLQPSPIMSHGDIVKIATAWPQLRELHLGRSSNIFETKVDITSLTYIAEKLPHLQGLNLPVDFSELPPAVMCPQRTGHRLSGLHMKQFSLGSTEPVLVAKHLKNLFPWAVAVLETRYYSEVIDPEMKLKVLQDLFNESGSRAESPY